MVYDGNPTRIVVPSRVGGGDIQFPTTPLKRGLNHELRRRIEFYRLKRRSFDLVSQYAEGCRFEYTSKSVFACGQTFEGKCIQVTYERRLRLPDRDGGPSDFPAEMITWPSKEGGGSHVAARDLEYHAAQGTHGVEIVTIEHPYFNLNLKRDSGNLKSPFEEGDISGEAVITDGGMYEQFVIATAIGWGVDRFTPMPDRFPKESPVSIQTGSRTSLSKAMQDIDWLLGWDTEMPPKGAKRKTPVPVE